MNSTLLQELSCPYCGAPVELVPGPRNTRRLLDPGVRLLSPSMQHKAGAHVCAERHTRGLRRNPEWRDAAAQ